MRDGRRRHQPRRQRRQALGFWLTAALLAGGLLLYLVIRPDVGGRQGTAHRAVTNSLDQVALRSLDNPAISLSAVDLRGRVTLLCFWGTWCPPCREELPLVHELVQKFRRWPEFQILAVSCGEGGGQSFDVIRRQTLSFLQDEKLDLPTYCDIDEATRRAARELGALDDTYPTTMVIDDQGVIRGVWKGYSTNLAGQLTDLVNRLLEPFAEPRQVESRRPASGDPHDRIATLESVAG